MHTTSKKLQVFVSSTYTDLKSERQAAVEAILTAGHIPAGMELFTAGDESQMDVIKRWIDESDVFLLILGGRYGTIETKTGKSYPELEYEYALGREKPLFAVVIEETSARERVKLQGVDVYETKHRKKYEAFRKLVTRKMVRFWNEPKDIKLAILETMAEFSRREDLVGWIRGGQGTNVVGIANELTRLSEENARLRLLHSSQEERKFNGLTFDEVVRQLRDTGTLQWVYENWLKIGGFDCPLKPVPDYAKLLNRLGLVENTSESLGVSWELTRLGKEFINRLTLGTQRRQIAPVRRDIIKKQQSLTAQRKAGPRIGL